MKIARKMLVLMLGMLISTSMGWSQKKVLFTMGDEPVYAEEFLRTINKNQTRMQDQKPDLQESLDLFINFKLKVKEALDAGLDTTRAFVTEMNTYREQLGRPYLMDHEVTEELIQEAYERSKYELRGSHILVAVALDAPVADTVLAYQEALQIRQRLLMGDDFATVAAEVSEDPSAKENGGDLGYFTVFTMVYPFENAMYKLDVGEISQPIRTQYGYHILKLTDKRPSRGKVKVAQIWKAANLTMSEDDKAAMKREVDSIYRELQNGADFAVLANKHSDDRTTGPHGGVLPWFGFGEMHPDFVEAAFSLDNIGDISSPIQTNMGYHIIKLLDRKPPETFEEMYPRLQRKIKTSDRAQKSEDVVINRLKEEYDFEVNQDNLEEFYRLVDPKIFDGQWDPTEALNKRGVLFTLDGKKFLQTEFAQFLTLNMKLSTVRTIAEYVDDHFENFVRMKIMDYEETKLEEKYPEYRHLLQEFRDGNLIFTLSNDKIWSRASQDTLGLKAFYNKNAGNYLYPERLDAGIVWIKGGELSDRDLRKMRRSLQNACEESFTEDNLAQFMKEQQSEFPGLSFEIKTGQYAHGDIWVVDEIDWKPGLASTVEDGSTRIMVWIEQVLAPSPIPLEQIRGQVTADYQDYLEKEWTKELRARYPVKINQETVNQIDW